MGTEQCRSLAGRILAQMPAVREQIRSSPDFAAWRDGHRSFHDGKTRLFLVGGDIGKDEEELMLDWARDQGLLDERTIAEAAFGETNEFE
jgi:hypothetical protein